MVHAHATKAFGVLDDIRMPSSCHVGPLQADGDSLAKAASDGSCASCIDTCVVVAAITSDQQHDVAHRQTAHCQSHPPTHTACTQQHQDEPRVTRQRQKRQLQLQEQQQLQPDPRPSSPQQQQRKRQLPQDAGPSQFQRLSYGLRAIVSVMSGRKAAFEPTGDPNPQAHPCQSVGKKRSAEQGCGQLSGRLVQLQHYKPYVSTAVAVFNRISELARLSRLPAAIRGFWYPTSQPHKKHCDTTELTSGAESSSWNSGVADNPTSSIRFDYISKQVAQAKRVIADHAAAIRSHFKSSPA